MESPYYADWEDIDYGDEPDVDFEDTFRSYRCNDGFCGALDCDRCHPGNQPEDEQ